MGAPNTTDGPWLVNPAVAFIEVPDRDAPICALLWPTDLRSEAETLANAYQLAASGALYDALETLLAAVDKMDRGPSNGGGVLPIDKALATGGARTALALARGES